MSTAPNTTISRPVAPIAPPTPTGPVGTPYAATTVTPPAITAAPNSDSMDQQRIRPAAPQASNTLRLKHPALYGQVQKAAATNATPTIANESDTQRLAMFFNLYNELDDDGKNRLKRLLSNGKLMENGAEDQHTTLYHLYAMANSPRLNGINGKRAAADLIRILDAPQTIVQTFVSLLPQHAQRLLHQFNLHPSDLPKGKTSISQLDYLQSYSADCVPASIMGRQAISHPAELTRQINEITGLGYFNETVTANEIWPKNPAEAEDVMKEWHWTYTPKAGQPGAYNVRFITPESVKLRMMAAHTRNKPGQEQSPIEGGYQGTLAYQGTAKQYNGLLGKRWDPSQKLSIGLNAIEKTVLENAIADGKSLHSVQYQIATGKQHSDDGGSYLFGYTVPFADTMNHLKLALDLGWDPVVGFVETDAQGKIDMAHEVLVTDYTTKGDQVYYKVHDTDDDNPKPVWRAARELIPKLHHVGYPYGMAKKIEDTINTHYQKFYLPDNTDRANFDPITVTQEQPMNGWEEMVWPEIYQSKQQGAQPPNPVANTAPTTPTPAAVPTTPAITPTVVTMPLPTPTPHAAAVPAISTIPPRVIPPTALPYAPSNITPMVVGNQAWLPLPPLLALPPYGLNTPYGTPFNSPSYPTPNPYTGNGFYPYAG